MKLIVPETCAHELREYLTAKWPRVTRVERSVAENLVEFEIHAEKKQLGYTYSCFVRCLAEILSRHGLPAVPVEDLPRRRLWRL
jgi:hypothetical protein